MGAVRLLTADRAPDLDSRITEIKQQAERKSGCPQIIQALGVVNRTQYPDCLQLDQYDIFDQQIGRIRPDDRSVIMDRDTELLEAAQTIL
jgi:hypothetical protein